MGFEVSEIGIFSGKKADYNIRVLRALLINGPLKRWELAKKVSEAAVENNGDDPHNVYSILIRKGGRLDELTVKGYVVEASQVNPDTPSLVDKIGLTLKGLWAALIYDPALKSHIHPDYFEDCQKINVNGSIEFMKKISIDGRSVFNGFNAQEIKELLLKYIKFLASPDGMLFMAEQVKELIESGISLDRIKIDALMKVLFTPSILNYFKMKNIKINGNIVASLLNFKIL